MRPKCKGKKRTRHPLQGDPTLSIQRSYCGYDVTRDLRLSSRSCMLKMSPAAGANIHKAPSQAHVQAQARQHAQIRAQAQAHCFTQGILQVSACSVRELDYETQGHNSAPQPSPLPHSNTQPRRTGRSLGSRRIEHSNGGTLVGQ
jgi:hypothetical protein